VAEEDDDEEVVELTIVNLGRVAAAQKVYQSGLRVVVADDEHRVAAVICQHVVPDFAGHVELSGGESPEVPCERPGCVNARDISHL
jgi:hypothetical protein